MQFTQNPFTVLCSGNDFHKHGQTTYRFEVLKSKRDSSIYLSLTKFSKWLDDEGELHKKDRSFPLNAEAAEKVAETFTEASRAFQEFVKHGVHLILAL